MSMARSWVGLLVLLVVCVVRDAGAGNPQDAAVRGQFAEVRGLLSEAEQSARGVRGAGAYLAQLRQMLNQAESNYNALMASQTGAAGGKLQTYNPFGYELKRAPDGTLIPTGSGPVELSAQAEAWAKQMKQVVGRIDAMRTGDQAALSREVEAMLSDLGGGPAGAVAVLPGGVSGQETLGGQVLSEVAALSDGKPASGVRPGVVPPLEDSSGGGSSSGPATVTPTEFELGKMLPVPKGAGQNPVPTVGDPTRQTRGSTSWDGEHAPGEPINPDYAAEFDRLNLKTLSVERLAEVKRQQEDLLKRNLDEARRDISDGLAMQKDHDRVEKEAQEGKENMQEIVKDVGEHFLSKPDMKETVKALIEKGYDYSKNIIKYQLLREEIARLNADEQQRVLQAVLRGIQNEMYQKRLKPIQDEIDSRNK